MVYRVSEHLKETFVARDLVQGLVLQDAVDQIWNMLGRLIECSSWSSLVKKRISKRANGSKLNWTWEFRNTVLEFNYPKKT